jgi:hypothetical protein
MAEPGQQEKYEALIYACHALAPVRTAVVHPCDETSPSGAVEAAEAKMIKPVPRARIRALAASFGLDISAVQLIDLANAGAPGLLLGARAPIILASRADNVRTRVASCAVAAIHAHARRVAAAEIRKLAG